MTYGTLKNVLKGLLTGDRDMPRDNDVMLALLGMAYDHISNHCQVLSLMTLDKSEDINRIAMGEYLLRVPELPTSDDADLDIDHTLGYVVASYLASLINAEVSTKHEKRVAEGIKVYNGKVQEFIETLSLQEDGTYGIAKDGS